MAKCKIIEKYGVINRRPIYVTNGASNLMLEPTTDAGSVEYWEHMLNKKGWAYALIEVKFHNDNNLYFSIMCPKMLEIDELIKEPKGEVL